MFVKRLLIAAAALAYLGFLAVLGAAYFVGLKQASVWPPAGVLGLQKFRQHGVQVVVSHRHVSLGWASWGPGCIRHL